MISGQHSIRTSTGSSATQSRLNNNLADASEDPPHTHALCHDGWPAWKRQGCDRRGAKYNSSGVALIGLAEVVDSITAIEEFVFGKGNGNRIPMSGMINAITTNWGGGEEDEARPRSTGSITPW